MRCLIRVCVIFVFVLLTGYGLSTLTPPPQPVEVTWRGVVGPTKTMYHKETGEEVFIDRRPVIWAGSERLYVTQETYDSMQCGDTITAEAMARLRRQSKELNAAYESRIDQCREEKLARPPKLHR
jgi:hypothetical protein